MRLKKTSGRTTVRGHINSWKTWPLETGESDYCPRSFRKMPHRRPTDTEPMDRILLWAVQLQGQWRSISTELSPDRHGGWPPHPSQKSGGCSTIIEEREVSWSRQRPSRTGPSRWRGCNHRSQNNLQQDLSDRRMANPWTQSLVITLPRKGNLQQYQNYRTISLISHPSSHAEDHTEQTEATSGEDHRRRTGRLQSRKKYHRADLQPTHSMWEISPAPARPLPCLYRRQEGLRQGLECSFVGNDEEVHHQHQPCLSHQKPL